MSGHAWTSYKRFPWTLCGRCGLVRLKNRASDQAARKECPGEHRLEGVHVSREKPRNR